MRNKRTLTIIMLITVVLLSSTVFTACIGEDTLTLEKNLYHDMEKIDRLTLDFLRDYVEELVENYDIVNHGDFQEKLDMIQETADQIKPPKHMESETNAYLTEVYKAIDVYQMMIDEPLEGHSLDARTVDMLDNGKERIYDGFKEFDWKN